MPYMPPPLTPEQLIALLNELTTAGCCERRKNKDGETVYTLSVNDIYEGGNILSGTFRG